MYAQFQSPLLEDSTPRFGMAPSSSLFKFSSTLWNRNNTGDDELRSESPLTASKNVLRVAIRCCVGTPFDIALRVDAATFVELLHVCSIQSLSRNYLRYILPFTSWAPTARLNFSTSKNTALTLAPPHDLADNLRKFSEEARFSLPNETRSTANARIEPGFREPSIFGTQRGKSVVSTASPAPTSSPRLDLQRIST
ncbi:hypothetical protein C8R44DRAFT_738038 [Mycena epipterygia]|nr:hypothetical protein C8R44DRAFT_738038 [Mycena epipterygia]